jgi:hypothetical protein
VDTQKSSSIESGESTYGCGDSLNPHQPAQTDGLKTRSKRAHRSHEPRVVADLGANFVVWGCVFGVMMLLRHWEPGQIIDPKLPIADDALAKRFLEFVGVRLWLAQLAGAVTAWLIALRAQRSEGKALVATFRRRCAEECASTLKTFAALFFLSVPILVVSSEYLSLPSLMATADINFILAWVNVGLLKMIASTRHAERFRECLA